MGLGGRRDRHELARDRYRRAVSLAGQDIDLARDDDPGAEPKVGDDVRAAGVFVSCPGEAWTGWRSKVIAEGQFGVERAVGFEFTPRPEPAEAAAHRRVVAIHRRTDLVELLAPAPIPVGASGPDRHGDRK